MGAVSSVFPSCSHTSTWKKSSTQATAFASARCGNVTPYTTDFRSVVKTVGEVTALWRPMVLREGVAADLGTALFWGPSECLC